MAGIIVNITSGVYDPKAKANTPENIFKVRISVATKEKFTEGTTWFELCWETGDVVYAGTSPRCTFVRNVKDNHSIVGSLGGGNPKDCGSRTRTNNGEPVLGTGVADRPCGYVAGPALRGGRVRQAAAINNNNTPHPTNWGGGGDTRPASAGSVAAHPPIPRWVGG